MKVFIGPYPDNGDDQEMIIEIDQYDTWSMDNTLAHIVLPMLEQLKETKQGSPFVDMADRPEHLRVELDPDKPYETDTHHFEAWDWVLGEMIFAFDTKTWDWEQQFQSGEVDRICVPCDELGNDLPADTPKEDVKFYRWDEGPNHTFNIDMEGRTKFQERISNGFRLFGKYYESLWD